MKKNANRMNAIESPLKMLKEQNKKDLHVNKNKEDSKNKRQEKHKQKNKNDSKTTKRRSKEFNSETNKSWISSISTELIALMKWRDSPK
jgi:hypothetical protein